MASLASPAGLLSPFSQSQPVMKDPAFHVAARRPLRHAASMPALERQHAVSLNFRERCVRVLARMEMSVEAKA